MIIPYYELRVKKYKTHFWMSYCFLQSCPEYTDPTVHKPDELNKSFSWIFYFSSIDFSTKIYEFPSQIVVAIPGVIFLTEDLVLLDEAGALIVEDHGAGGAA